MLSKTARRTNRDRDWIHFMRLKKETPKTCRKASNKFTYDIIHSDPGSKKNKRLGALIKSKRCGNIGVSQLEDQGFLHPDPKTKANILNKLFTSVFSADDVSPLPDLSDDHHPTMDNITVCQNGIFKLLRNLKSQDRMVFQQSFWKRLLQRYHQQSPCCSRLQSIRTEFLPSGRRLTSFPSIRKEVGLLQQTTTQSLWLECCANYVSIYFTVPSSVTSPTMRSCRTPSMGSENGPLVTPNWLSPWKTWPKDLTTNHKLVSSF